MDASPALTDAQRYRIGLVYAAALLPLLGIVVGTLTRRLPPWIARFYALTTILAAAGWEVWWSFGLLDGDDVNARRSPALNAALPMYLNWAVNSLADGAICVLGLWLVWLTRSDDGWLRHWDWGAFGVLFAWFVGQNVVVECYVYHGQIGADAKLSWAPFVPTGKFVNPTLLTLPGDRPVSWQGQESWVIMTPIVYALALRLFRAAPPSGVAGGASAGGKKGR